MQSGVQKPSSPAGRAKSKPLPIKHFQPIVETRIAKEQGFPTAESAVFRQLSDTLRWQSGVTITDCVETAKKYGRPRVMKAYADFTEQPVDLRDHLHVAGVVAIDVPVKKRVFDRVA